MIVIIFPTQGENYVKPFAGWKVVLCISRDKLNTMEKVLRVGGANVVAKG